VDDKVDALDVITKTMHKRNDCGKRQCSVENYL